MVGQRFRDVGDDLCHVAEEADDLLGRDELRDRVGLRLEPLSEQHLDPALLGEELGRAMLEEAARRAEQLEPFA